MSEFVPKYKWEIPREGEEEEVREWIPLVHRFVNLTVARYGPGVARDHIESELMLALLRAVRMYDSTRIPKLSYYSFVLSRAVRLQTVMRRLYNTSATIREETLPELNAHAFMDPRIVELAMIPLNERQRYIIRRIYLEGASLKEVCDELDLAHNTISIAKKRAITLMRKFLKHYGVLSAQDAVEVDGSKGEFRILEERCGTETI